MTNLSNELLLVPHTSMWEKVFQKEKSSLEKLLRSNSLEIQHIGSTAITEACARPIMDILCVVHTLDGIEVFKSEFEAHGFSWKGDGGMPNSIQFIRYAKDGITELSNIRIFEKINPIIDDFTDFRDYLNAEEEVAKEYSAVKLGLQKKYEENPGLYTAAKNQFIKIVLSNLK